MVQALPEPPVLFEPPALFEPPVFEPPAIDAAQAGEQARDMRCQAERNR